MSRRIDIELTSSQNDGTWTWRAAGARQPRGVLDGSILAAGAKVGDVVKVEVEQEIDGMTVLSVVHGREKAERALLELIPDSREFQPVIETRARRERGERPRRDDGDRRPRRGDGDKPGRDGRGRDSRDGRGGRDAPSRGAGAPDRGAGDANRGAGRPEGASRGRGRDSARRGPSFTPPPEIPQRPKPKRLRPGKANRAAVLADLPAEQRPIGELALQGLAAVRQRLKEDNEKAAAEGRAVMPEASVMKMAEELMPKLRVAEWRDRAEAAKEQADELDLRDLRSVVVASSDPIVARDESTRTLVEELKHVLAVKQEQELRVWFGDIDAALAVGRVIRALRLSSQPPKAGVPFPSDIAQRLVDSTNASLAPMNPPDRWSAMLEAAAFSPVRTLVKPLRKPDVMSEELTATVTRLAPALPNVAALFEIEVDAKAPMPKPLRPTYRSAKGKAGDAPRDGKPADGKGRDGGSSRPKRDKSKPGDVVVVPPGDEPVRLEPVVDATASGEHDAVTTEPVSEPAVTGDAPALERDTTSTDATVDETPQTAPAANDANAADAEADTARADATLDETPQTAPAASDPNAPAADTGTSADATVDETPPPALAASNPNARAAEADTARTDATVDEPPASLATLADVPAPPAANEPTQSVDSIPDAAS